MSKRPTSSASPPPPEPASIEAPATDDARRRAAAVARAERRLRVLEEISETGMRLMRKIEDPPAGKGSGDAPATDPAADFALLSRAVRLTIILEVKAEEDLRAALAGDVEARAQPREARERPAVDPDAADEAARMAARDRLEVQVGRAICRESESETDYVERIAALDERLKEDDSYDDVCDRPFREVVARLCKEIGLDPDWSDWTDEGWPPPPRGVPQARMRWSPFHRVSPGPIFKRNRFKPETSYELADPP